MQTFLTLLYCRLYFCSTRLYFLLFAQRTPVEHFISQPLKERYFLKCHFKVTGLQFFFPSKCFLFQSIPVTHTWYLFWSVHKGVFIQKILCYYNTKIDPFMLLSSRYMHLYGQFKRACFKRACFIFFIFFVSSTEINCFKRSVASTGGLQLVSRVL